MSNNNTVYGDYQKYQLQWMIDHGYGLDDFLDIIIKATEDNLRIIPDLEIRDAIEYSYNDLESVNGFNGELWASVLEWYQNDYE